MSLLTLASNADTFSLKHTTTDRVFGPFESNPGSNVVIGNSTFTVVNVVSGVLPGETPSTSVSPVMSKLQSIIIPNLEVRSASPEDCIRLITEMARVTPEGKNINIVNRFKPADPFSMTAKTVTFDLHKVLAHQMLLEVCAQAGLKLTEENGIFVITE